MNLQELKQCIQNREIPDDFIIFACAENNFIANTYIEAICEIKQLEKTLTDSIFEQDSALSLVMGFENNLRVIYTETFDEAATDYSRFTNTIVVCEKVDKKLAKVVADYVIDIPALEAWQVKSYMQKLRPNITTQETEELYAATKGNIYRIVNELDKINLFDSEEQSTVHFYLTHTPESPLYEVSNFALADALVKSDLQLLRQFLQYSSATKAELLGIVGLALNKVKLSLLVEFSNMSAEDLGITPKQYSNGKRYPLGLPLPVLQHKLDILSSIDLKLKSGLLDMSNQRQLEYLILRMVG